MEDDCVLPNDKTTWTNDKIYPEDAIYISQQYLLPIVQGDLIGQSEPHPTPGSVSQQVWHDKDPSLLKGHRKRRALI